MGGGEIDMNIGGASAVCIIHWAVASAEWRN
jgi:hypothetical protein